MMKRFSALLLLSLAMCPSCRRADQAATPGPAGPAPDFVAALTHIAGLAATPAGRAGLETSYDRTGGNQDGHGQFSAVLPDGTPVLADLKGPGCVRRVWLTGMPPETRLYFRFDGEKEPRLAATYAQLRGEGAPPFVPPLCDYPSGAGICYLPFPYAQRLLITTDRTAPGAVFFYHVNYDSLPAGTAVQSWRPEDAQALQGRLDDVGRCWSNIQSRIADKAPATAQTVTGKTAVLFATNGPACLQELRIRLEFERETKVTEQNRALRSLVLRIFWDGLSTPSVEVPLGDFFCNGVRSRTFNSLALGHINGEYICRFPMPFAKFMSMELDNPDPARVSVKAEAIIQPLGSWPDNLNYFHAAWNQSAAGGRPHEILKAAGPGHYVGCYLLAIGTDGSWNILEGDESIYRDDEVMPSMHGTGLEDYFNGGWYYSSGIFDRPLSGAVEKSAIRTGQYRLHVPDPVTFSRNLRANIEFGDGNKSRGYMSSVAYWYAKKPGPTPYRLPAAPQRAVPRDPLEPSCMMVEIFQRELVGSLPEAEALCREYAEKYPTIQESELMGLRASAYREALDGFAAVSNRYRIAAQSQNPDVRRQAELLLWLHEAPTNALLAAHVSGRYRVYWDGAAVLQGEGPVDIGLAPVGLTPGPHVLAAEVTATRPPYSSFSACLRSPATNIWTDASWKLSRSASGAWTGAGFDDSGWIAAEAYGPLPQMGNFQFRPNAIVLAHYRRQLLAPTNTWSMGEKVYFRKVINIP